MWRQRRLFLVVRPDPAEPNAQGHEVGAQGRLGLGSDPPSGAIIAAMALGEGGGERGLADPAQAVQGCDSDPTLIALQRRLITVSG